MSDVNEMKMNELNEMKFFTLQPRHEPEKSVQRRSNRLRKIKIGEEVLSIE
jgi:hypothetical protein